MTEDDKSDLNEVTYDVDKSTVGQTNKKFITLKSKKLEVDKLLKMAKETIDK